MNGFVHILKQSDQESGASSYAVIFAPVGPTGTGGAVPSKTLHGKDELVGFLRQQMHIHQDSIRDALKQLEANGNASIAFVELPKSQLRDLRLIA